MTKQERILSIRSDIFKTSETITLSESLYKKLSNRAADLGNAIKIAEQNIKYSKMTKAIVISNIYSEKRKLLEIAKEEIVYLKSNMETMRKTIKDLKNTRDRLLEILNDEVNSEAKVLEFKRSDGEQ